MSRPPDDTSVKIRELLALYRRTHYRVVLPDQTGSTIQVGLSTPDSVSDWIGADGFAAYMTSCNPYSQALSDQQNDKRLADLREQSRRAGARFLEGIASVPDEPWFELSLLVTRSPLTAFDAFARTYEQNAVVVVPARGIARLRVYRGEWRFASVDAKDIEWLSPDCRT